MRVTTKKFRNFYFAIKRNLYKDIFVNNEARGDIKFGICLFNRFTISDRRLQVMGDELQARAIVREVLLHCPEVRQCRIYDIKEVNKIDDDIVFVMWAEYPIIKRRPKKYILWLQNAGFANRLDEFLRAYDYVFSPSKKYCRENARLRYLPMACEDIDFFRKMPFDKRFESDVCFVGNFNGEQRPTWLQRDFLVPATRYNFGLWGTNWDHSDIGQIKEVARGRLEPKDIPAAYSSTKIVLANHWVVHRNEEIITTRIYEALACEAFIVSDYFEALDEFKDYMIFTNGGKDLEGKLEYFLAHPEKRHEKIKRGRDFIVKNHTFKNRVETIAKTIGLEFNEVAT